MTGQRADRPTDPRQPARIDPAAEWRSTLSGIVGACLLFAALSGFIVTFFPFGTFTQLTVLTHTIAGVAMLAPLPWFVWRHWRIRGRGNLSHYQLLGYVALLALALCVISGIVLTAQGLWQVRVSYTWQAAHLVTGAGVLGFVLVHLLTVAYRRAGDDRIAILRQAQWRYIAWTGLGTAMALGATLLWSATHVEISARQSFAEDYNWRFGDDRPFAPSLARLDYAEWFDATRTEAASFLPVNQRVPFMDHIAANTDAALGLFQRIHLSLKSLGVDEQTTQRVSTALDQASQWVKGAGAIAPSALAGSEGCGRAGCHSEIYAEWLPGAHRYASLDDMFQRVQVLMAEETSPEHTRYCAGCHDPISLFGGAKNTGNITLSAEGSHEGISCVVCHSIVQADVQGNGDYTVSIPSRYVYEERSSTLAQGVSDFLIRTYPEQHIRSYARPLYKTPEFCAACHKQYVDTEVNTDIGKVQGQNQYDSWKNSRWYHEDDSQKTIGCRECHMPLQASADPARGDATDYNRNLDDRKHRSHRFLGSNQYIPVLQKLEGGEAHVALTEEWLRGEIDIPEISNKWTEGPVVRLAIQAPAQVSAGEMMPVRVILTNNKTGHDFPTGPLDMIESWVELKVTDSADNVIYHVGALDEDDYVSKAPLVYKSDGYDREGALIDRHNLWDLVGSSYKRAIYPGVTDAIEFNLLCPSMARPRLPGETANGERQQVFTVPASGEATANALTISAVLWYRKANPEFLDRVYGLERPVRSPATAMSSATSVVQVITTEVDAH